MVVVVSVWCRGQSQVHGSQRPITQIKTMVVVVSVSCTGQSQVHGSQRPITQFCWSGVEGTHYIVMLDYHNGRGQCWLSNPRGVTEAARNTRLSSLSLGVPVLVH
ncbi:hypothetical protein E2C01_095174 [Portunus trituberculatus]|uniref:Uncharacterized protein n=1 Tax=Portunus trituberculatus TaxID=210409 RepID=A0A5B7JUL6_PORTR|nr:hypothetical protein [Portunus trituberculatus]